jgi:hypothetical protein
VFFDLEKAYGPPAVGRLSSEHDTSGMSADVYHYLCVTSFRPVIFSSGLGMFCLCVIHKKKEYHKDRS